MLRNVQILLKDEWKEQADLLQADLEKQKIGCRCVRSPEDIDTASLQTTVLLTDDRKAAAEWKRLGGICIGCTRSNEFFDGAELATDSLQELDRITIEETLLHGLGLPVTIAATERLVIREIAEADTACLYQMSLQAGMEYLFRDSQNENRTVENCFAPERMLSYIKTVYRFCGYGLWGVWIKGGKLIGCCGLSDPQQETMQTEGELELQYMLAPEEQHKGYGAEMCSAALDYAFERIQCERISARIHKENEPSIRLAFRLGFTFDQTEDAGIEVYRLKKEEWIKHKMNENKKVEKSS